MDQSRRVGPLVFFLPTILAIVIAIVFGAYIVATNVGGDSTPDSTITEFGARSLAKSAYSNMEHNTVSDAVCDAIRYRKEDDTWEIECRLDETDARVITVWEIAPDMTATLLETRTEPPS